MCRFIKFYIGIGVGYGRATGHPLDINSGKFYGKATGHPLDINSGKFENIWAHVKLFGHWI